MIGQLVLIACACTLLAVAYGLLVKRNQSRVHTPMFLAMLRAARSLGMGERVIVSEPRAPKGFVYVIEKRNLTDSLHLLGQGMDASMTGTLAHRFFDQYPNIGEYRYEFRGMGSSPFRPGMHAVIKNLTDGGGE